MKNNIVDEYEEVCYTIYGEGCDKTKELIRVMEEGDVKYFYREIGKDCNISELYKIAYRPDCILPLVRKSGGRMLYTTDELWVDIDRSKYE